MQVYRSVFVCGLAVCSLVMADEPAPPEEMGRNTLSIATAVHQAESLYEKRVSFLVTVTLKDASGKNLVVADATAGIWVRLSHLFAEDPQRLAAMLKDMSVGSRLEIWGTLHRGNYRPVLEASGWRVLGQEKLPPPPQANPARFFRGEYDCDRIRVTGVVERWREVDGLWDLLATTNEGKYFIRVPKRSLPNAPDEYIGQTLDVSGIATGLFNTRGELVTPGVTVNGPADVALITPTPEIDSSPLLVPLDRIDSFRGLRNQNERVRTRGVITLLAQDESIYIQKGLRGVIVDSSKSHGFRPGDRVEVVGTLNHRRSITGIDGNSIRLIDHPGEIEPTAISPADIVRVNSSSVLQRGRAVPSDFFAVRIRFTGRVYDLQQTQAGGTLLLDTDGCLTTVSMSRAVFLSLRGLQRESTVEITGVTMPPEHPATRHVNPLVAGGESFLQVLISDASDLVIISRPPWWTPSRLTALLAATAAVLIGGIIWNTALSARVTKQAAKISGYVRSQTLLDERLRVARELHDTMEQDLACLMMKIDAEVSLQEAEQPRGFLQGVRRHLAQIQAEAHDFLWDLRDPIRISGNLSAAMVSQIEYLQAMTDVPIRCRRQLGGIFVAPRIQHAILRIAREGIGNAIRHAAASQIDVSIKHNKGIITLVVADDGVGFEKSDVACLEGHYGLIGMRERIEQIGGRLEIEASPGRGTKVCATVMTDEQEPVG
mgnify:CR=1 FL=1